MQHRFVLFSITYLCETLLFYNEKDVIKAQHIQVCNCWKTADDLVTVSTRLRLYLHGILTLLIEHSIYFLRSIQHYK